MLLTLRDQRSACLQFLSKWTILLRECSPSRNTSTCCLMRNLSSQPILVIVNPFTRKGWSISASIVFSEMTWSTYLSFMMSAFFSIFIAKYSPVFLFLVSLTLPNEPLLLSSPLIAYLFLVLLSIHNLLNSLSFLTPFFESCNLFYSRYYKALSLIQK